ncbi:hypothetical protein [Flexibacterium corallicola]|uniref:hypothetical protein n=1 Tax=Flexibacterium corallicola TaxID=3037259 RepID=UPI00286F4695|nr:hypothetical protein [Pseudovibrio sp. M1P-2-3]
MKKSGRKRRELKHEEIRQVDYLTKIWRWLVAFGFFTIAGFCIHYIINEFRLEQYELSFTALFIAFVFVAAGVGIIKRT